MKSLFKFLMVALVVAQQLIPTLSLLPSPSAYAAGTVVPTPAGGVENSCPGYLQNILVYKGKSIRVYDKMTASSSNYVKIVHNLSEIDRYNGPNATFGSPVFNIISDVKPKNVGIVYWVYDDLIVQNHAGDRSTVAAQFVYKLASVIFPNEVVGSTSFIYTTNINPVNQTTTTKNPSGTPIEGTINNECQNIYVGFCGDGVVDNGGSNFVEGSPSTFGSVKLNGGEQCDDGNTINNDSCDNTCKIVNIPTPTIDLELDKQYGDGGQSCKTYNVGDTIPFKIVITNKGTTGARNFTVKDYIPAGFSFVSASNGGTHANGVVTRTIPGPLAPNQSMTVTLNLKSMTPQYDNLNRAEICNYEETGEPQDGDSDPCTMGVTGNPSEDDEDSLCIEITQPNNPTPTIDLELDKQYGDGGQSCKTYNVGDTIPFKIVITNKGTTGARNFTVKDYIPAGFSFVSASNGGTHANGVVTRTIPGPLAPNQSMTVTLSLKVVSYQPDNLNRAEICNYEETGEPQDGDSDPCTMGSGLPSEDDEDSLCIELNQPATPTVDIELTKSIQGGQTMFMSGNRITFVITITNKGTTGVNNASIRDYLPWGNVLKDIVVSNGGTINGTTITWNGISLKAGETKTFTIQGTAVFGTNEDPCNKAEAGNYENSGGPQDGDSDGRTMGPTGSPSEDDEDDACRWVKDPDLQNFDLEVKKTLTDPTKQYKPGDLVGYRIVVSNKGNMPMGTFKVNDYLPQGVQYVSSSPAGQYYASNHVVYRTLVGGLPAYGQKVLFLTGKILSEGTHMNCVELGSYTGLSSGLSPHDIDSDPDNMDIGALEDDESCVEVTATNPVNPAVCKSLAVTPTSGTNPLALSYFCDATNATSYSIQLIQNGAITILGTTNAGSYTITNPGTYQIRCMINGTVTSTACQKTVTVTLPSFIDLNIKKIFADTNSNSHAPFASGDLLTFKLIVGNSGNAPATNFTVKDYLPSTLSYVSSTPNGIATPNGNGTTVTWNIPGPLAPGATMEITLQARLLSASGDRNRVEVCDYEENGELQDPDSRPCNMGPNGYPSEDDEDQLEWNVIVPNPQVSCDSLTMTPVSGTVPYPVSYTCKSTNGQSYTIKLFGGNLGPNGLVVAQGAQGSFVMSLTGVYQAQCIVDGTVTSHACSTVITGNQPTTPPPAPVCNYLHVTPQAGMSPTNVQYICNGSHSSNYVVNIAGPSGFNNQSVLGSTGGLTLTISGTYTFTCNVGGSTSSACSQTVYITGTRPDIVVVKSVVPTSVKTNDMVTYTVNVSNTGNGDAQEFFVTDDMPSGVVYQSGTCALGGATSGVSCRFNQPNQIYVFFEAGLKAGQTTSITYQAKVVATGGIVRNVACADPCNNEVYPLTGNNCDDAEITIIPSQTGICNAWIQKSAQGTYRSGDLVTWNITYGNNGSGACYNVLISDLGGVNNSIISGTSLLTISSLLPGQTGSLTITGVVYGNSGDKATNTAKITTQSTETTTTDNTDDAEVLITSTIVPTPTTGSIGNYVRVDTNGNGIQDAGELGIGGVTVRLYACNGTAIIATTTTDSNGYYMFNNLPAGNYQVEFVLPNGYTWTTSNAGSNDATDSDVVGSRSHCITLNAGETNTTIDAGVRPIGTPNTGVQCLDLVATPVYGVPGQVVNFSCQSSGGSVYQIYVYKDTVNPLNLVATLYGQSVSYTFATAGSYIAKCMVDGSVDYKLDYYRNHCLDTLACAYKIRPGGGLCAVKQPLAPFKANYIEPTDWATMPAPIEYCTDSELATLPCHDNSNLNKFTVVRDRSVCNETVVISGNIPAVPTTGSIGNYVRVDTNGNGIQDAGEYGIGGVTVRLYACNGTAIIATTSTDSNGYYMFNNLPAGNYQVEFVLPNGYTWTTSNAGSNDATDSDVVGSRSHCITLNAGETNTTIDAGVILIPTGGGGGGGGYNPIPLPPQFSVCGNGRVELGEYCDYRAYNISLSNNQYIITDGAYKGKICQTNCTIANETNPPKCMDIDPPSINEGEVFPFRWNIDNSETKVVSSCSDTNSDAVLKSSMICSFNVYNGKQGTTSPVLSAIRIPCYSDQGFDSTLMEYWRSKSADADGRKSVIFDAATTKGVYGEYKIELNKIEYKTCDNMGSTKSFDGRVCQYNFVVGEGYMISKGANISTLKDTNILGYYGFSSNTPRFDLYLRGVQQSLTLNAFDPTRNMSYLTTEFVDKYSKLAENAGVNKTKVPGKSIYLYDGSVTLKESDINDNSTIIVKGGNLRIEGTVAKNVLYVVPNGAITFGGDANCEKYTDDTLPQIVQGIFVAGQGFDSDDYLNTNTSKSRCHNGGLRVRGTLIGRGVDKLIERRRVVLNDRFQGTTSESKTQHIIDGASLLLNPNASLWTSLPGADEIATILGVEKK